MSKKYKVESQFRHNGKYIVVATNLSLEDARAKMKAMDNEKNHKHYTDPFYVVRAMGDS